ncbi:MAG: MBL fold metallo-hydrolase [Bacteroidales bacterium]|nr:MBL fold metallo-hydrolase [Bacteroidales bacterium]
MQAKLTFLGTGTSLGVPIVGCKCEKCTSTDKKDKRFRASAFVQYGGLKILIDAGPDFRSQMLAADLCKLDAILLTHNHKDHTGGLDDVRALNYIGKQAVSIWCEKAVFESLKQSYGYIFTKVKYPGAPEVNIHLIDDQPFIMYPEPPDKVLEWIHDEGYRYRLPDGSLMPPGEPEVQAERADDPLFTGNSRGMRGDGIEIIPIRGFHDKMPVLGFRFGQIAYITDMSLLPESEFAKLQGLKHLTLNTVSYQPHHSHFSLDEALTLADKIGAENTWLTHLSHSFPRHKDFEADLSTLCRERGIRSRVRPAFDGLTIE